MKPDPVCPLRRILPPHLERSQIAIVCDHRPGGELRCDQSRVAAEAARGIEIYSFRPDCQEFLGFVGHYRKMEHGSLLQPRLLQLDPSLSGDLSGTLLSLVVKLFAQYFDMTAIRKNPYRLVLKS